MLSQFIKIHFYQRNRALALWLMLFIASDSWAISTLNAKFEYTLRVSVDYAKREAHLKRTGEPPSQYEKLMKSINGSVEVADIVDTVNFTKDQSTIRSIGTVNGVLGFALSNQRLTRDSIGKRTPEGLSSLVYQEVRGNTEPFTSKVDPIKKMLYFSVNGTQVGSSPVEGRLIDSMLIPYLFIGEDLPKKNMVVQFTDGRSLKKYTLIRAEPWDFPYNGEKVRAIRFYKATSKDDDTSLQVWLSEKEHLPLRYVIGLKDEYGVTLQVDLKKIPVF